MLDWVPQSSPAVRVRPDSMSLYLQFFLFRDHFSHLTMSFYRRGNYGYRPQFGGFARYSPYRPVPQYNRMSGMRRFNNRYAQGPYARPYGSFRPSVGYTRYN